MSVISYSVNNKVAEILFNNPPVNALSIEMLEQFLGYLEKAGKDDEVRAVIIGSQVSGRFSAGLNLKAVDEQGTQTFRKLLDLLYIKMTHVQFNLGKPSITAIDGTARGGGMTIAISCDLIVASKDASFGYPEIDAGVLPSIHFTHLPRIIGKHRAFDLLFTGRSFYVDEAYRLGLVSRIADEGKALEEARALAQVLAAKPKRVVEFGRQAFVQNNDNGYQLGVLAAADSFCSIASEKDALEGIRAFVEKREARWEE